MAKEKMLSHTFSSISHEALIAHKRYIYQSLVMALEKRKRVAKKRKQNMLFFFNRMKGRWNDFHQEGFV